MQTISLFNNKRIVLGVTGSIAVYKAVDLASKLTQAGAVVEVIMTDSAQKFVAPLTFQAVTGRAVYTDLWQPESSGALSTHIAHVGLGESADLLVIAPATANTVAKLAHGLADDLLSITALTVRCPIVIAPAMDGGMYEHPATQANLTTLKIRGATIIEPEEGRFASGLVGKGRLPETSTLIGHLRRVFGLAGSLSGKKVIVTAGGTREAIDPVRYVTNRSSGKQGYAIAQAAIDAGAEVILISTVESLAVPVGAMHVSVSSAQSLLEKVIKYAEDVDVLIMAAAVADFRPAIVSDQKIKKSPDGGDGLTLEMIRTQDILVEVKAQREKLNKPTVVIGFAAESQDLLQHAQGKLQRKGLDMIVANDITAKDAGFQADTNRVVLIDRSGNTTHLDLMSKEAVGTMIIQKTAEILAKH